MIWIEGKPIKNHIQPQIEAKLKMSNIMAIRRIIKILDFTFVSHGFEDVTQWVNE